MAGDNGFADLPVFNQQMPQAGASIAHSIAAGQQMAMHKMMLQNAQQRLQEQQNLLSYKKLRAVVSVMEAASKEKNLKNRMDMMSTAASMAHRYGFIDQEDLAKQNMQFAARDLERYQQGFSPAFADIKSGDPARMSQGMEFIGKLSSDPADLMKFVTTDMMAGQRTQAMNMRQDMQSKRLIQQTAQKARAGVDKVNMIANRMVTDLEILGNNPDNVPVAKANEIVTNITSAFRGGSAVVPEGQRRELEMIYNSLETKKNQFLSNISGRPQDALITRDQANFLKDLATQTLTSTVKQVSRGYNASIDDAVISGAMPQEVAQRYKQAQDARFDTILKRSLGVKSDIDKEQIGSEADDFRNRLGQYNSSLPPEKQVNIDAAINAHMQKKYGAGYNKYLDLRKDMDLTKSLPATDQIKGPSYLDPKGGSLAPPADFGEDTQPVAPIDPDIREQIEDQEMQQAGPGEEQ
jgi:hypothetical protein